MSEGHPAFVANNGRIGWGARDAEEFAPEAGRPVRLVWLAVRRDCSHLSLAGDATEPDLYATQLGPDLLERLAARLTGLGVRADAYHLVPGKTYGAVEPRLTVRKELLDSLTIKGAAGLYHQAPTTLVSLPVVDMAGLVYGLQQAVQIDLGVEWKIFDGLELTVDGYLNPLLRTVEMNPFDPATMATTSGWTLGRDSLPDGNLFDEGQISSHGWAYGLEVMLRHPLGGNWFGWLSYSLQRSTRYVRFRTYDAEGFPDGHAEGYLPTPSTRRTCSTRCSATSCRGAGRSARSSTSTPAGPRAAP